MIQIRHVPDKVHRTLKARAANEGMTLSDYLLREVRAITERPTIDDMLKVLSSQDPVVPKERSVDLVRQLRDAA